MRKASISQAKNGLSALLDRVRNGHSITIEDRGVPVARLEPIVGQDTDPDGRLARLERQGIVKRPVRVLSVTWLNARPPRLVKGRAASALLIEERGGGR
jgi:prevent-host-death family protein